MRILTIILIISLLGNLVGLLVVYKYFKKNRYVAEIEQRLADKQRVLDRVNQTFSERLVFIHHSVGRNWLDEGGLRDSLMAMGIGVHGASRQCDLGKNTDLNHWLPKFEGKLETIFKFDQQTGSVADGSPENDIIMFKSCYPNSNIVSDGAEIGNPYDETRTLSNYRATFDSLKNIFSQNAAKKFIYVTAPPLVPSKTTPENAARARQFNNWLTNEFLQQYREDTVLDNFYIFDFFDLLADEDNVLKAEYRRSDTDAHPNAAGSKAATAAFIEFVKENEILSKS